MEAKKILVPEKFSKLCRRAWVKLVIGFVKEHTGAFEKVKSSVVNPAGNEHQYNSEPSAPDKAEPRHKLTTNVIN
jgi:hypothetical protein